MQGQKLLSKEKLAELIIYSDIIHDILTEYDFNYDMKMHFNRVEKSVKQITKFAFGHESIGELDDFKHEIRLKADELIKDKIYLKAI